jgi:hypothetical protein
VQTAVISFVGMGQGANFGKEGAGVHRTFLQIRVYFSLERKNLLRLDCNI